MIEFSDLKPLQRETLLAILKAPDEAIHRVRGGYSVVGLGLRDVFTVRTVRGLERDGLVGFSDRFGTVIRLTARARKLLAAAARDDVTLRRAG